MSKEPEKQEEQNAEIINGDNTNSEKNNSWGRESIEPNNNIKEPKITESHHEPIQNDNIETNVYEPKTNGSLSQKTPEFKKIFTEKNNVHNEENAYNVNYNGVNNENNNYENNQDLSNQYIHKDKNNNSEWQKNTNNNYIPQSYPDNGYYTNNTSNNYNNNYYTPNNQQSLNNEQRYNTTYNYQQNYDNSYDHSYYDESYNYYGAPQQTPQIIIDNNNTNGFHDNAIGFKKSFRNFFEKAFTFKGYASNAEYIYGTIAGFIVSLASLMIIMPILFFMILILDNNSNDVSHINGSRIGASYFQNSSSDFAHVLAQNNGDGVITTIIVGILLIMFLIMLALNIYIGIASISLAWRRMHDAGLPGPVGLITLLPYIQIIVFVIFAILPQNLNNRNPIWDHKTQKQS